VRVLDLAAVDRDSTRPRDVRLTADELGALIGEPTRVPGVVASVGDLIAPPEDTFRIELAAKDLRLILTLGREVGADLRQSETNLVMLEETEEAGFRGEDVSAVARYLRDENRAPPTGVPERGG